MHKITYIAASVMLACMVSCSGVSEEQALADYQAYCEAFEENFNNEMGAIQNDEALTDEEKQEKAEACYDQAVAEYVDKAVSYIKKYPSGELAVTAFKNIASMLEDDQLEEVLGMLKGAAAEDEYVVKRKVVVDALKATAEGQMFTDFEVVEDENDPESTVKFSDYVGNGKYVLVDFWASWCGPCKREIPNIAAVYEKYKGDDFDVLSIAVWDKPEDTKVAAAEHSVVWSQIINAQRILTDIYGITGIPHIMLIGPDGTILKRNLRGDDIAEAVAEALGR